MVKRLDKGFTKQMIREAKQGINYANPDNLEKVLAQARLEIAAARDPVTLKDGFGKWFAHMIKNFGAAGLMVGSAILTPIAYDHLESLEGKDVVKKVYKAADTLEDVVKNPEESSKDFVDSLKDFGGKVVDGVKKVFYGDSDDVNDTVVETPDKEPIASESRAEDIGIPDSGVDDVYFAMGDSDREYEDKVFYSEGDVIGHNNFEVNVVNGSLEQYLPLFGNESRKHIEIIKGDYSMFYLNGPFDQADRVILYPNGEGLYVISIKEYIPIPEPMEDVAVNFHEKNEYGFLHTWIGELKDWADRDDFEFDAMIQDDDLSLSFYSEAPNKEEFNLDAGSHRLFKIGQNEYNVTLETVNWDDVTVKVQVDNGSIQNYTMKRHDDIQMGNVSLTLNYHDSNSAEFRLMLDSHFSMNYDLDDVTKEVSNLENITRKYLKEVPQGVVVPDTLYLFDVNGDNVSVTIPKADTEFGWMNVEGSVSGSDVNFVVNINDESELAKFKFVLYNDTDEITVFDIENVSSTNSLGDFRFEKSVSLDELHGKYTLSVYVEDQSGNNVNYLANTLVGYGDLNYDALDFDVSGATGVLHGTLVTKDPQTVVLKNAMGDELQNKTFVPDENFDVYADFDLTNYTQGAYYLEFQNTIKKVTLEGLVYDAQRLGGEYGYATVKIINGYEVELLNYTTDEAELKITNLDTGENETRTFQQSSVSDHMMYNTMENVLGLDVFVRDIDTEWGAYVICGKRGEVNNGEKVVFDNKEFSVVDMIGNDIVFKDSYGNYKFVALGNEDTFYNDGIRFYVDSWAIQEDVSPIVEFDLDGDVGDPYWDGYSEGHSEGYVSGYSDGKSDGYDEGYSEGYDDGLNGETSDYSDGYRDGYNDAQEDSANDYVSGYNAGLENGTADGYEDGHHEGYQEGYLDGRSAGENATKDDKSEDESEGDSDKTSIDKYAVGGAGVVTGVVGAITGFAYGRRKEARDATKYANGNGESKNRQPAEPQVYHEGDVEFESVNEDILDIVDEDGLKEAMYDYDNKDVVKGYDLGSKVADVPDSNIPDFEEIVSDLDKLGVGGYEMYGLESYSGTFNDFGYSTMDELNEGVKSYIKDHELSGKSKNKKAIEGMLGVTKKEAKEIYAGLKSYRASKKKGTTLSEFDS